MIRHGTTQPLNMYRTLWMSVEQRHDQPDTHRYHRFAKMNIPCVFFGKEHLQQMNRDTFHDNTRGGGRFRIQINAFWLNDPRQIIVYIWPIEKRGLRSFFLLNNDNTRFL